jgi:hypothetical protein
MDGGRSTIAAATDRDPASYGFMRITDGNPCSFCAMIASRGAVYKTAANAGEARKWHNKCGCTVAPAFTPNPEIDRVASEAQDVYYAATKGVPNPERAAAFRKAWNNRNA